MSYSQTIPLDDGRQVVIHKDRHGAHIEPRELDRSKLKPVKEISDMFQPRQSAVIPDDDEFIIDIPEVQLPPRLLGKFAVEHRSRLLELADNLNVSRTKVSKNTPSVGAPILEGRHGHFYVMETDYKYVAVSAHSKRHWSSIKHKLKFLELYREGDHEGVFRFNGILKETEAQVLREIVGIKKKPSLVTV